MLFRAAPDLSSARRLAFRRFSLLLGASLLLRGLVVAWCLVFNADVLIFSGLSFRARRAISAELLARAWRANSFGNRSAGTNLPNQSSSP
jgi:hypothetical protein